MIDCQPIFVGSIVLNNSQPFKYEVISKLVDEHT